LSDLKIRLRKLTPKQELIDKHPAKNKILVEGRRFGKTTLFADKAIRVFWNGGIVIEAAPVAKQTNAFWRYCKNTLRDPIERGAIKKWENERIMEWEGGRKGYLQTQTAWNADTFRGGYADVLLIDEFSLMKDSSIWDEVGAPMMLDTNGSVWMAFTPKLRNFAYNQFLKAQSDTTGEWVTFHGTSWDNPYLSRGALERAKRNMTESAYRQEIMAEFLEGEGTVFRNISACMNAPLNPKPEDHKGHRIVAGVDWAKQQDYTAISVGCSDCEVEIERDRFNKIDYHFQRGRIKVLCDKWSVQSILVELNSIGEPNFEELQRSGLPVSGFQTTAVTKPQLIENMALTLEKGEWQFQNDKIWTGELEAYERSVSDATGRSSYSAPSGMHDDTVIARALMLRAAMTGRVEVVENPFYK